MDDLTNMFADTTGAVDAVELPSAFMDDTEGGRIFQSELDQLYAISVEPFRSPEPFRMQLQPAALVVEEHSAMATEAAPGFQGTAYVGYATSIQHQGMTAEMHPAGTAVGEPSTMFTNVAAGTGVPGVHYASYVQHQPMMLDLQQGHAFGEDPFGMGTGVAAGTGAAAGLHYPAFQHQPMMLQTQPEAALVGEPSSMLTNAVTGFDASAYLRYAASLRHPLFADQNSGQAVDLQHHLQNISPAIGGIGQPVFVPGGAVPVAETNGAPPMQVMTQGPYAISAIILPELETPMIRVPPEYPAPGEMSRAEFFERVSVFARPGVCDSQTLLFARYFVLQQVALWESKTKKSRPWTDRESRICIDVVKELSGPGTKRCGIERMAPTIKERLYVVGFDRSVTSIKIAWNRRLRQLSGYDERREPNPNKMRTSMLKPRKRAARRAVSLSRMACGDRSWRQFADQRQALNTAETPYTQTTGTSSRQMELPEMGTTGMNTTGMITTGMITREMEIRLRPADAATPGE